MNSLSREQIRSVDRCAIETIGVPGAVLMENAGRRAADLIEKFLLGAISSVGRGTSPPQAPQAEPPKSVAVVAGSGNNGGDGFVVARHMAMRGAKVVTFLVAPPDKITGDAKINLDIIRNLGHDIRPIAGSEVGGLGARLKEFDVIVDAVGGTGIRGELRGDVAMVVEGINACAVPVVAIDIPTGLDCDTGEAPGATVRAAMTVTMVARKKGFDSPGASAYTGEVHVVDIGVPAEQVARMSADAE